MHKLHLVNANLQKKPAEFSQPSRGQIPAPVQVITAGLIRIHQELSVTADIASQSAGDRPQAASHSEPLENRVRHQARHASVAVIERMNPKKPMVSRCYRNDLAYLRMTFGGVGFLEALKKSRKRARGR